MKLKLDLHTHCCEALGIYGWNLSVEPVGRIVAAIKAQGLDGIAITEHWNKERGFQVKRIVEEHFNNQVVIIPGQEIAVGSHHVVELYLPDDSTFRFLAHPSPGDLVKPEELGIQGIEIESGGYQISQQAMEGIAKKYDLLPLRNSDAHSLNMLGQSYNKIDLEDLCIRAVANRR